MVLTLILTSPRGCLQMRLTELPEVLSTCKSVGCEGMLISWRGIERNRLSRDLPALFTANTKKMVVLSIWWLSLVMKLDAEVFAKVTSPWPDDSSMV